MTTGKSQLKVLKGSRVIDGTGAPPLENGVVVVDGNVISAVGTEKEVGVPEGATVIELRGCTLMPGLMDVHIHLVHEIRSMFSTNPMAARFDVPPELQHLQMVRAAQVMLEAGFTTVRDSGGGTSQGGHITAMVAAIRDAFDSGILPGPRVVVAGLTVITNAHLHNLLRSPTPQRGVTGDGPWELRKIAREHLRAGADYLKTSASGGIAPPREEVKTRNMVQEELDAIVDEAHAFNKRAACHCHTPEAIRMAVAAGVDTIEHCGFTDEDAIALLVREKKIVVPTLAHRSQDAIDHWIRIGAPDGTIKKMIETQPTYFETFRRYHQAGVKMACGTDNSMMPGQSAMELRIYVEQGMTPMEAILTATKNAAEAIGRPHELGTLEPGKLADIIAVKGNPLSDIRILEEKTNFQLVIKDGAVFVDRRSGDGNGKIQHPVELTAEVALAH